jgi:hypothetical protein
VNKLRELAERWKHKAKGYPPNGETAFSLNRCATELLSILDAEGDGGAAPFGWWVKYANGYEDFIQRLPTDPDAEDVPTHAMPLYTHPPAQAAQVDSEGNALVPVASRDASNYCRILSLLGMEEDGDPVAWVERMLSTTEPVAQGEAVDVKLQAHRYFVDTYTNSLNPANADHVFKAFTAGFELAQAIAAQPRAVPDGFLPNGTRVMWQSSNGTEFPATITAYNPATYDAVLDDGCDAKGFSRHRFFKIAAAPPQGESA